MPSYILQSGRHYMRRAGKLKRYVPGDRIEAEEWEVSAIMDRLKPLDPPDSQVTDETGGLELRHKGAGWYDVVNTETGQKLNDASLRKSEAEELIGKEPEEAEEAEAEPE